MVEAKHRMMPLLLPGAAGRGGCREKSVKIDMKHLFGLVVCCTVGAWVLNACTPTDDAMGLPEASEEVAFVVNDAWLQSDESRKKTRANQTMRHFLGLLGQDSVFITLTEDNNPVPLVNAGTDAQTRGEYDVPNEFMSFDVKALMDLNNTTPVWAENVKIYKPTADGEYWSGDAYWPKGGYTLHFFAHSWNVWEGEGVPIAPLYSITGTTGSRAYKGEFSYQLPEPQTAEQSPVNDAARQPDLIFAIAPEKTQANSGEAIDLKFLHALAAVRFKFGTLPDDVEVVDAILSLGEVVDGGNCTFAHPLDEGADFDWTLGDGKYTYTIEGFQGKIDSDETFMFPPQTVGNGVVMKLSIKVGEKWYNYEKALSDFSATIPQWKANKRYTYTISISEYVEVTIEEDVTNTVKSNVRIQNTGLTTSYIRAAIVGYWENADGTRIISPWNIEDATIGTLVKSSEWADHWAVGEDGFYYHKTPVKPGEYTNVPLFDKYELKSTGPEAGAKLIVNIVTQAVAKDMAEEAWGVSL